MASLIVTMLKVAGVKSYRTWIGTRDLPYKYSQVPTPLVDNHMIATYIAADGQYYFWMPPAITRRSVCRRR